MRDSPNLVPATGLPFLHEENGELSLHFGFPTIQSRMSIAEPGRLVLDYTRTMMGFLLFQPNPANIAMIGLGGGSLAKYCHRTLPKCDFTAVELLPEVIALRRQFGIPEDGKHFRIICADGAEYVRLTTESLDVLLIDGFDLDGQPEQLCSVEFYDQCFSALRNGGVLVVNLCVGETGYKSWIGRISTSFSGKVLAIDADEGDNKIVFAAKGTSFPPSLTELVDRLRTLESAHQIDLDKTAQKILKANRKDTPTYRRGR